MKKNYFLLLALLCSLTLFVGCDKDDPAWKNIPPTFEKTTTTINGTAVSGTVAFKATGDNAGVLTLDKVIAGYDKSITMDVAMKEQSDGSFTFDGQTSLDKPVVKADATPEPWMLIKVNGTVKSDGSTGKYDLTVNITTSGWNVVSNIYTGETLVATVNGKAIEGPVTLIAESESLVDISFPAIMTLKNYTIEDVTYNKEGDAYKFSGTYSKVANGTKDDNSQFVINGTLSGGVLTLNVTATGWGWISGTYRKDSLSVEMNGKDKFSPKPVKLDATSNKDVTVLFENVDNSLGANFEIPATFTYNEQDKSYSITGSKEKEPGFIATLNATLTADYKLEINLNTSGWKTLEYKYYSGKDLVMTYNGVLDTDGAHSVNQFKMRTATEGTLILSGPFLAMEDKDDYTANIEVDVTVTETDGTYSFKGENVNSEYAFKVTAEGTVSPEGVMTIAFDYKITSGIVGTWGVKMNGQTGDVIFDYKGADINIPDSIYNLVPANIAQIIPQTIQEAGVNQLGRQFLGQYVPQLKSLIFKDNGWIDIVFTEVGSSKETSMPDMIMYYIAGDQLFVFPNLNVLMGGMSASSLQAKATKAWDPGQLLNTGIPLKYTLSGNSLEVVLETATIKGIVGFAQQLMPLLGLFLPDNLKPILPTINKVLGYLNDNDEASGKVGVLANTTILQAGLKLEKK